ncbi:cytochrome b6 [Phtheirospermum japonicum]|uniref:Cytochrome b6 n=1 Tax=Phtheirospermum japonicum TaxID=374723 RepID=A0A830CCW6_9LAMI|nr:cytochrome b6 [Phtheirospermum japonicum]
MADQIEEGEGMVNITLQTVGPFPRTRLRVASTLKVKELRTLVAETSHLPLENMMLVFRGNVLHDSANGDDLLVQLHDGGTVIASIKPKPPAKHIQDSSDDDDGEDLVKSTSRWKRRLFFILRHKLKFPDMLLMAIFSLKLKTWAAIVVWFILAPVAHRLDIGPLYGIDPTAWLSRAEQFFRIHRIEEVAKVALAVALDGAAALHWMQWVMRREPALTLEQFAFELLRYGDNPLANPFEVNVWAVKIVTGVPEAIPVIGSPLVELLSRATVQTGLVDEYVDAFVSRLAHVPRAVCIPRHITLNIPLLFVAHHLWVLPRVPKLEGIRLDLPTLMVCLAPQPLRNRVVLSACTAIIIVQIIGTGFLIIFYNLGQRKPGDASAYSIFNEDFRELPGTLNADRLDRDIRLGQF